MLKLCSCKQNYKGDHLATRTITIYNDLKVVRSHYHSRFCRLLQFLYLTTRCNNTGNECYKLEYEQIGGTSTFVFLRDLKCLEDLRQGL